MSEATITYGEHAWEIEYEILSVSGQKALQLLKITGAVDPEVVMDQFFRALKPLWNTLNLPVTAPLVMEDDLIPVIAAPAPGSNKLQ